MRAVGRDRVAEAVLRKRGEAFDAAGKFVRRHGDQHLVVGGSPTITAIDPVTGDPSLDPDYRLQADSAAIDVGADAGVVDDIDGHPRPLGLGPDIGADEFAPMFADGFESGDTSAWSVTVP